VSEEGPARAAGYVRVSQERNARNGYGLGAQETDIQRYIEYKRLSRVGIYREAGASGYERERPELDRLLADAKAGKLDVVIFPSIDRAGRSVKDLIEIDAMLRDAGVDNLTFSAVVKSSRPSSLLFRISFSAARYSFRSSSSCSICPLTSAIASAASIGLPLSWLPEKAGSLPPRSRSSREGAACARS
jgi:hypothetical protein